ncbi:hypothetical protein H310_04697 [Aphanomyces invadans]|uniref:Methyltransferase small domain-containing protein n=1 Tax=Aphanomyces invadans TaxID=157072 RepID=A0A024UDG0_9STRA|nr:hypothetical protein H310_04697 [Aphanomyces invadans]ETW04416.1 hypothetical protein H310_04697 [Aphanomyces invadans]|eukprot:XP_008867372.1 hypothetical protein H310_04697 [Aphanomyces invadans]
MATVPATQDDLGDVYEPAEDTYLFLDALQDEKDFLVALHPRIMLELGPGSGVVGVFATNQLAAAGIDDIVLFAVDINEQATACTKNTASLNGVSRIEILRMDLLTQVRLRQQVDVLLFNPPYVPTPSDEVGSIGIEAAWAGGKHGREVIDRVLPLVHVRRLNRRLAWSYSRGRTCSLRGGCFTWSLSLKTSPTTSRASCCRKDFTWRRFGPEKRSTRAYPSLSLRGRQRNELLTSTHHPTNLPCRCCPLYPRVFVTIQSRS